MTMDVYSDQDPTPEQDAKPVSPRRDNRPQTPEAAMQIWRDAIEALPPLDFDLVKERLSKFRFRLPDELLTYDSFIVALSRLQNMRSDVLEIKEIVDEHHGMKERAIKNLQKVLLSMADRKTVLEKEGEAESWLIHLHKLDERAKTLQKKVCDILENIDMATMQLGRQIRVAETAAKTQTLDVTRATDLPIGWGEIDDDEELDAEWLQRRSNARMVAAKTKGPKSPNKEGDDENDG